MKTNVFRWFAIAAVLIGTAACSLKDDGYDYDMMRPSAIVTVKTDAENTYFWMQLDDKTVLYPVNLKSSPFGAKEVRALVNYRKPSPEEMQKGGLYDEANNVYVNWIDSILTKKTVPDMGELNDKTYGNDPLEIYADWATVVEDGYLTLHFVTNWSAGHMHRINLVCGTDPEDPYKVVLCHDAAGDAFGQPGDALVAFSLADLPDTAGQTVDLTLQWRSYDGIHTHKFPYCTRK